MLGAVSTLTMFLLLGQVPAGTSSPAGTDTLTAESLRAWMNSSGLMASNAKLIHAQMQAQKPGLPPWWPEDVFAQEEDAMQKVDMIDAAVPFYQPCFTETQARLLAKLAGTAAGKQVTKSALETHSQAALAGSDPTDAQQAGEDAATKKAHQFTPEEKQKALAVLTPSERAMAARDFAPAKFAAMQQCMNAAYQQTVKAVEASQMAAIRAVIEASRPALEAAEAKWAKEHPATTK